MTIAFFVVDGTISTASLILSRPRSTIKSFLQRYRKRGNTNNLPHSEVLTKQLAMDSAEGEQASSSLKR